MIVYDCSRMGNKTSSPKDSDQPSLGGRTDLASRLTRGEYWTVTSHTRSGGENRLSHRFASFVHQKK